MKERKIGDHLKRKERARRKENQTLQEISFLGLLNGSFLLSLPHFFPTPKQQKKKRMKGDQI